MNISVSERPEGTKTGEFYKNILIESLTEYKIEIIKADNRIISKNNPICHDSKRVIHICDM